MKTLLTLLAAATALATSIPAAADPGDGGRHGDDRGGYGRGHGDHGRYARSYGHRVHGYGNGYGYGHRHRDYHRHDDRRGY